MLLLKQLHQSGACGERQSAELIIGGECAVIQIEDIALKEADVAAQIEHRIGLSGWRKSEVVTGPDNCPCDESAAGEDANDDTKSNQARAQFLSKYPPRR